MADYVGCKVHVTTAEDSYEGIVYSIDENRKRLTLAKVEILKTAKDTKSNKKASTEIKNREEKPRRGNGLLSDGLNVKPKKDIHYRRTEQPVTQIGEPNTRQHSSYKTSAPTNSATGKALFGRALLDAGIRVKNSSERVTRDASDEGTSMLQQRPLDTEKYLMGDFSDEEDDGISPYSPPKTIVLQEFNDRFENAVKYISSQRVVGVSCEGVKLGRYGKVCWIGIGCRHFIYLFDILALGASCFDEGLGEILENGNLLKVFHDCRQVSDALYHQYSIKLVNVFDTQVADIIIYKKEKGELPGVVNGLVACLYEYLNISPEQCHFQKVRVNHMKKDENVWSRRPLPEQLRDAAAKRVMYLRELRLPQMERMMADFIYGVDIYLGVVRDSKDPKVKPKHPDKVRLVPQQFRDVNKFDHQRRLRRFDEDFPDDLDTAVHESITPAPNLWQEGQRFSEDYYNKFGRIKEQTMEPIDMGAFSSRRDTESEDSSRTPAEINARSSPPMPSRYELQGGTHQAKTGVPNGSLMEHGSNFGHGRFDSNLAQSAPLSDVPVASNLELTSRPDRGLGSGYHKLFGKQDAGFGHGDGVFKFKESDISGVAPSVEEMPSAATHQLDQRDASNSLYQSETLQTKPPLIRISERELNAGVVNEGSNSALDDFARSYQGSSSLTPAPSNTVVRTSKLSSKSHNPVGIFIDEDFPPLSSSDSEGSFSTTPPRTSRPFNTQPTGIGHGARAREDTRPASPLPLHQSPLVGDSAMFLGRGRASLYQRLAFMPQARLPAENERVVANNYELRTRRFDFPPDDELLATPEVTSVAEPAMTGGTRVRIRKL